MRKNKTEERYATNVAEGTYETNVAEKRYETNVADLISGIRSKGFSQTNGETTHARSNREETAPKEPETEESVVKMAETVLTKAVLNLITAARLYEEVVSYSCDPGDPDGYDPDSEDPEAEELEDESEEGVDPDGTDEDRS